MDKSMETPKLLSLQILTPYTRFVCLFIRQSDRRKEEQRKQDFPLVNTPMGDRSQST